MNQENQFYTLRGYQIKNKTTLTEAMEDYLEMCYRIHLKEEKILIRTLATVLHVKASSVSKMIRKLEKEDFVAFEKYGKITLTTKGYEIGSYLLKRHNTLVKFFSYLNHEDYQLEQVEKMEHFIDNITLLHMEQFINDNIESS